MFPNIVDVGPVTLHSYGLMLAIAFLVGLRVASHYGKKSGLDPARIIDVVIYIFISALIGAKLLHILVDFDYYKQDWSRLLNIYQVGGVYYGGFLMAVLVTIWYVRRHQMSFWGTADALSMGLSIGQMFGRIGCFLAGCCWGKECPTGFPFAITFTNPDAAKQVGTPLHVPLHPAQLYEAAGMLVIFLILRFTYFRRRFEGQQFFLYLLLYSVLRFTVEFFRGDPRGSVFNGLLSTSQFISLIVFVASLIVLFTRSRSHSAQAASAK
jgi:phosphatidylglycerol:prolipoprotein diacylglycerol transferase